MSDQVIDRGAYWEIVYPDGSDQIPKDPNLIDSAATISDQKGDHAMADRLRTYAKQIRDTGKPSPIGGFGMIIVGVLAVLVAVMYFGGKKGK